LELNFYSSLVITGIVQGFFLSFFILLFAKHRTRASIYLGLLILVITLSNLQELLWEIDFFTNLDYYLYYLPYSFAEAGLMYFFVMTFLYPDRKNTRIEKLLYLPFLIMIPVTLLFKFGYLFFDQQHPFNTRMYTVVDFVDSYGDFLSILLTTFVLIVLWKEIEKYQKTPTKHDRSTIKTKLLWLKILFIFLFIFIILWIYATLQGVILNEYPAYLLLIGISIVIYVMGYVGTRKIEVHEQRKSIRHFDFSNQAYSISEEIKSKHILAFEKILNDEKKFLDPSTTLESLAIDLDLSKSHLSRIINAELKTTFSDYINILRVNEAKKYLLEPEFSNYTLLAIGLEAGFNSKTTFNSAFKKFTGMTPSAFKKLHRN